jgi:hypothetical protein
MKTCSRCRVEKNKNEFGKNSCAKDGYSWYCKVCTREMSRNRKYDIKVKEKNDIIKPLPENKEEQNIIEEYDLPSRNDLENLFSKIVQKERNILDEKYHGINLRRNLFIRFLETYCNKEFSYEEVKTKLNDRDKDDSFYAHFDYLKNNNFIIKSSSERFKFCDRVKKWKNFGQI